MRTINRTLTLGALMMAAAVALSGLATSCQAAEKNKDVEVTCPSGIDHSAWESLLKKHVDEKGVLRGFVWVRD